MQACYQGTARRAHAIDALILLADPFHEVLFCGRHTGIGSFSIDPIVKKETE
jgi:hypothetical protein